MEWWKDRVEWRSVVHCSCSSTWMTEKEEVNFHIVGSGPPPINIVHDNFSWLDATGIHCITSAVYVFQKHSTRTDLNRGVSCKHSTIHSSDLFIRCLLNCILLCLLCKLIVMCRPTVT